MSALAARVAAVVPCKDEAERIAATVAAVAALPRSAASSSSTTAAPTAPPMPPGPPAPTSCGTSATAARRAALETGVRRVRDLERADAVADPTAAWPAALLFVDGDLQETATNLGVLTTAVLDGTADMTIATLPAQITAGGGRGPGRRPGQARHRAPHRFPCGATTLGDALREPGGLRGGEPARPRLGGRDRPDRRRAARRPHRARGALRAAAPGQRPRLARPGAPGRAVPRRLAGARAARLAAVAPGLTRAHRLCVGVALGLLLLVGLSAPNAAQPDLAPPGWVRAPRLPIELGPGAVTAVLWTAYLVGGLAVYLGLRGRVAALRTWLGPAAIALARSAVGAVRVGRPRQLPRLRPHPRHGRQPVGRRADHLGRRTGPGDQPGRGAVDHRAERLRPVRHAAARAVVVGRGHLAAPGRVGLAAARRGLVARRPGPAAGRARPQDLHGRVDVLWTLNPLVVGIGVLGAHIDVVASALGVAAVVVAARRPGWTGAALGGVFVALAGSTKFTYGVVAVGVVAAWWVVGHRSAALARLVGALVGGVVVVAGALHLWAGPHVYDQLLRSRQAVSLATPWRPLLEWGRDTWGNGPTRAAINVAAALLAVLLAWCLLRASRPWRHRWSTEGLGCRGRPAPFAAVALWVTACLTLAYSLAAPYSLPWYDMLVWCALPAVLPGLIDLVALVRLVGPGVAYVPGPGARHDAGRRGPHARVCVAASSLGGAGAVGGRHRRRRAERVCAAARASSSRYDTDTDTMSGTASVAATAGIATPESLIRKPIVSVMSNAIRPGPQRGRLVVGPLHRPGAPRRGSRQHVDHEEQGGRHEQGEWRVAEQDVVVLLGLADDDVERVAVDDGLHEAAEVAAR